MLPNHLKDEFDKLTPFQQEQFNKLVQWANAGGPGQFLMSDGSYEKILEIVQKMDTPDALPAEPEPKQE